MYHPYSAKKQKFSDKNIFLSLSNTNNVKKDILLEINGNSDCNINRDLNTASWIKFDLAKNNKQADLSGENWLIGISGLAIKNSFNSWKIPTKSKTDLPSLSFVKIGIKLEGKSTETIGLKYFENRSYSKVKVLSQLNSFLSGIWTNPCHLNTDGVNIVGEIFSLVIFAFYWNKLDDSIHMLSLASISNSDIQKSWDLFMRVFNFFKKDTKSKIERIEIFISNELIRYLGDFQIPQQISNFKSDKDLTEHDKELTALDTRCGLIPQTHSNESIIDIISKYKIPEIRPSLINVYTNIPIVDRPNEKLINGRMYQLLAQIPMKNSDKNLMTSIQHFPEKILYKSISQNFKMDIIEILLIDPETNSLINLNNNFMVNLDFKCVTNN